MISTQISILTSISFLNLRLIMMFLPFLEIMKVKWVMILQVIYLTTCSKTWRTIRCQPLMRQLPLGNLLVLSEDSINKSLLTMVCSGTLALRNGVTCTILTRANPYLSPVKSICTFMDALISTKGWLKTISRDMGSFNMLPRTTSLFCSLKRSSRSIYSIQITLRHVLPLDTLQRTKTITWQIWIKILKLEL